MVATNLEMTHGEDAREDAPSSAEIRLKVKQPRSDPVAGTRSEHRRAARLKCGLNVRLAKQTAHTTHERGDKPPRRFDATLRETCGDKTASPHHRGEKSRHANGATVPSCTSSVIAGCSHGRQARKGVQKTKPKAILRLNRLPCLCDGHHAATVLVPRVFQRCTPPIGHCDWSTCGRHWTCACRHGGSHRQAERLQHDHGDPHDNVRGEHAHQHLGY